MEVGAHVWLRHDSSRWGWVPAIITKKQDSQVGNINVINLTLENDSLFECSSFTQSGHVDDYYAEQEPFEIVMTVDPEQLKTADHDDIKLRNLPRRIQMASGKEDALGTNNAMNNIEISPSKAVDENVIGGVNDLIGLTHLHEPAILHALRLRYDSDIIYTSTGPILIAINPFKPMPLYTASVMDQYRRQGEQAHSQKSLQSLTQTPFKRRTNDNLLRNLKSSSDGRLPPHAYQTADDAYRSMMRGLENDILINRGKSNRRGGQVDSSISMNQSILVSGESGAGKTVTTKIVLNYLAMLSKMCNSTNSPSPNTMDEDVSIEQQVLQSNPILESFGNARTIRNDNSSRFGKYIDVRFTSSGRLIGASIETYLLEKIRLIHPAVGERNYHVFYQFLSSATETEREQFYLDDLGPQDFKLLSQTGTYDRRDQVRDEDNHHEMLEAMITIGFRPETIQSLMRLAVAILFAGNMTFTTYQDDTCSLDENHASLVTATLLGITFEDLASAITERTINTVHEQIDKRLSYEQANKASEALIKAVYGGAFDYIVRKINDSIDESTRSPDAKTASIGILDIFGFETFQQNNFEQLCINYTNEALQQQFNKYVFKLEQIEYENEGILWKYISFPDNQDVLDLIDMKHTGILAILDEQCVIPQSTDEKFTRYLYSKCDKHKRFSASSAQRVDYKFSVQHYAGNVEYSTDSWIEKNKDQLPGKSTALLKNSSFKLLSALQKYVRSENRGIRGSVITKSVGFQFSNQLKVLRERIDSTTPHYIRCLKPNDELVPNYFEPKNVVQQLRCGGVLEAVRVSRAGYPTRYPHDVFLARYYVLGDDEESNAPISPTSDEKSLSSRKMNSLKNLISNIAFSIWEADNKLIHNIMEVEKAQNAMHTPKYNRASNNGSNVPVFFRGSAVVNGPMSLAVESSTQTPPEKRNIQTKHRNNRFSIQSVLERTEHSQNLIRPETIEEYNQLDYVSRCAVAGLQLGRTKVFLRREAFDRIEAMRAQKFFGSAVLIQTLTRGYQTRKKYLRLRSAVVSLQALIRLRTCKGVLHSRKQNISAVKIQCFWRVLQAQSISRNRRYGNQYEFMNKAATLIQARARGIQSRDQYYATFFGIIKLQALYRGYSLRRKLTEESRAEEPKEVVKAEAPIAIVPAPTAAALVNSSHEFYRLVNEQNWSEIEKLLDKHPKMTECEEPTSGELPLHVIARHAGAWSLLIDMVLVLNPNALLHKDNMGALPLHHAAAHNNVAALEIIYPAYKEAINQVDVKGRLPLHVAAEFDAVDSVKFLLSKNPDGAFTMIYRPIDGSGGGLPLHVAARNYASIGVITSLLAENFASAKRSDENGDLPLHLMLKCGDIVDQVAVKTLLTCFSQAASRTDMNGDLPLVIAIKNRCKPAVVSTIMMSYPSAVSILTNEGQSPLHLALENDSDDRVILGLLNYAPEMATVADRKNGLLPIQIATGREHSHFIVHNLLKRDMPIDVNEKVRAQLVPHHYSWNHIVSNTDDMYHQVVTKVLQQCTQPQVLALAHVEGPNDKIALASATPVCKHELRVMLRLFNTLEVVNQRPAYTNPMSDTQIFYALRYDPPPGLSSDFTVLHEEKKNSTLGAYVEDFDDTSVVSSTSKASVRSNFSTKSMHSIDEKLRVIRKEKGQQVIAKLTSRSDVVERELRVRKDYHLSRHYVPAIISVHHTVQHAAYSEAMAEPGYCITMEGADTTAENLMLDLRRSGQHFPLKALKRIGISLLHMHEHGLTHCDLGTHNIGKFGSRWKLLGVGGSVPLGRPTNPNRGFYHPPESIVVETKKSAIGKKAISAVVVSIPARTTYDIWAFGVVMYEALAGAPLSPYACRGKRAMSSSEVAKIGQWDEHSVMKSMKYLESLDENGKDLIRQLLHYHPERRIQTMREVLEHPFFSDGSSLKIPQSASIPLAMSTSGSASASPPIGSRHTRDKSSFGDENIVNGPRRGSVSTLGSSNLHNKTKYDTTRSDNDNMSQMSGTSRKSKMFGSIRDRLKHK